MAEDDTLDDSVRRSDLDLWLSSRFIADEAARADVVAIYALASELARVRTAAREPLIREIRLTWWREGLEAIAAGAPPRGHPVLQAMARPIRERGLPQDEIEALIDGAFERLGDGVSQAFDLAVLRLAAFILWPKDTPLQRLDAAAEPAARAWTLAHALKLDRTAVLGALRQARPLVKALPPAVFPAFAHVTLARVYAAGRTPSDLSRRWRITWAVLRGQL